MSTTSAAEELAKINHYFAVVQKHPEGVRRLDLDTLLEHTRRFYDALQSVPLSKGGIVITMNEHEVAPEPAVPAAVVPKKTEPKPAEPAATQPEPKLAPKPAEPVVPIPMPPPVPEPVETQPIHQIEPMVQVQPTDPPAPAKPDESTVAANDPAQTVKDTRPVTVRTPMSAPLDPEFEELFAVEPVADLGGRLAQTSIPDLRRAISINDKLQYIRSLFHDDSRAFDSAIDALNQMSDLLSAKHFIQANLLLPYAWMEEEKRSVLKSFVRLLHRRYKHN
jgi:hypothetical protein